MATVIKRKKAISKKKKAAPGKKRNILGTLDFKTVKADLTLAGRVITGYRAAIHPGNGYGEIEVAENTGAVIKIFAATNPALFSAVLTILTHPSKAITQGGYVYTAV